MSIALSSGCKPQILHSNLLFSKTHFANHSPNVISFPKPLIFLTQVRISTPVELHPCGRRCSSRRIGSSLLPQDPVLGEGGDEEEDVDGLGNRGSDWGQQDEGSDEESAGFSESGGIKQAFAVPPEGARLFVGNLPFDIGSEDLAAVFQQAGVVEIAEVIYNRETNQSRGFGFVSMSTVEEADKAVNIFNGYDLNGRLLNVNKASRRGSQPIRQPGSFVSKRRIFVGNLAWEVDDARLEEFFSEHGKVVEARVVYETDSGRSRGFGFVKMSTDKEVDEAIAHLDGKSLDGRVIRVSVAEERPRPRF